MDLTYLKTEFKAPSGKLDFITIALPEDWKTDDGAAKLVTVLADSDKDGRVYLPSKLMHFTIQDPTTKDLQKLINNYPDLEITAIEISLDFLLVDKTDNPIKLDKLRLWFAKNLYPAKHQRMSGKTWRKYYAVDSGERLRDALITNSKNTVYWGSPDNPDFVRLYKKTYEDKKLKDMIRIEISLHRGGCQEAGVYRLVLLPSFIKNMRSYLSAYFCISKGVRHERLTRSKNLDKIATSSAKRIKDESSYESYGALWLMNKGKESIPDSEANRWMGQGLKKLRENLLGLSVPDLLVNKVAEWQRFYDVIS